MRCFVQARDTAAVVARLEDRGARVGTIAGDVITATVPVNAIPALAGDPQVARLESAAVVRPKLDRVARAIDLKAVHSGLPPLTTWYRGAGVVVGVVDISLDLSHPAFQDEGRSRVVALWDQGGQGSPPDGFDYGRYCGSASIRFDACPLFIYSAHGTHVTGAAAGSEVPGSRYTGVAPASDIAFVQLVDPVDASVDVEEWLSASVCDGVAFVFDVAESLGEPAVVNLSLGTHVGPHDGSSLASACLDNLVGPGRIIVAAAGNEGEPWLHPVFNELVYVHASGDAGAEGQRVDFVPGEYVSEGDIIDIWFDEGGEAPTLRVGVQPDGSAAVTTSSVAVGDELLEETLAVPGMDLGPVVITSHRTASGSTNFQVRISDANSDLAETELHWFFVLEDAGKFDAFLDVSGGGGFTENDSGVAVDTRMSVGYPAVAKSVIAVGSTVSRRVWIAASGGMYETLDPLTGDSLTVGQLSTFSSRGPSRAPEQTGPKPTVVAPGEMVASAMPNAGILDIDEAAIVTAAPDGYFVSAGTSHSSPVVAGVVALMLERDPSLDPDQVRDLLQQSAVPPDGVAVPSDDWGYGAVDAAAAVAATREVTPPKTDPPPSISSDPEPGASADTPSTDSGDRAGCGCQLPSAEGAPSSLVWTWLVSLLLFSFSRRRGTRVRSRAKIR